MVAPHLWEGSSARQSGYQGRAPEEPQSAVRDGQRRGAAGPALHPAALAACSPPPHRQAERVDARGSRPAGARKGARRSSGSNRRGPSSGVKRRRGRLGRGLWAVHAPSAHLFSSCRTWADSRSDSRTSAFWECLTAARRLSDILTPRWQRCLAGLSRLGRHGSPPLAVRVRARAGQPRRGLAAIWVVCSSDGLCLGLGWWTGGGAPCGVCFFMRPPGGQRPLSPPRSRRGHPITAASDSPAPFQHTPPLLSPAPSPQPPARLTWSCRTWRSAAAPPCLHG